MVGEQNSWTKFAENIGAVAKAGGDVFALIARIAASRLIIESDISLRR
jgi:hypothetical protein